MQFDGSIAFIADSVDHAQGGTEGQLLALVSTLRQQGVSTEFIVLRGRDDFGAAHGLPPATVLGVRSMLSFKALGAALKIAFGLRRRGTRIAHLFFNDVCLFLPFFLRLAGIEVVVSRRDMGFWYTPARLKLLRLNRHFVSAVIANSRAVANNVRSQEKYRANRVCVIYNGLVRRRADTDRAQARRRLGITDASKVVGLVANLRPLKRMDLAVRALPGVLAAGEDARLVIVGEDGAGVSSASLQQELQALAASLGVADRVHFHGLSREPELLIPGFDVCLLCSDSEGFSNSILEYMSAARPVVCTRVGGAEEIIIDGTNGVLIDKGDHQSLERAIRSILSDAEFAARLGQAAVSTVQQRFTIRAMADAHLQLYRALSLKQLPPAYPDGHSRTY